MTREEAITIIEQCKENGFMYTPYTLNQYHEALEKAIEALKGEPTGFWITDNTIKRTYCSECKDIGRLTPYCSHCGAKMTRRMKYYG